MKNRYSVAVITLFLASVPTLFPDTCSPCSEQQESYCCPNNKPHSYLRLRSQASNTARQLVGWQELINSLPENPEKKVYGVFASTVEYQRSFNSRAIADYLLGCPTLSFKGSQVADRNNNRDLVADYFGLPTDFVGKLSLSPVIDNFIFEPQLYVGFCDRFFFKMNAPVVHSRWDLGVCDRSENVSNSPTAFPVGYMGIDVNAPEYDTDNSTYLSCGNIYPIPALATLREGLSGQTFGEMSTPWNFGKIPFCRQEITRIAAVEFDLGFNLVYNDCVRLGFYGMLSAPTGNKANPEQFFSPVVGNGQHWELGAGLLGFIDLIKGSCNSLSLYFEGNVSHLFDNYQVRSFDFKDKPLSRYLLMKQIGKMVLLNNNTNDLVIEDSAPAYNYEQTLYAGNLINAINYATRRAKVGVPVRGDFSVLLALGVSNATFDVGYNIYGNSKEELCIDRCQSPCGVDNRKYALKGTTGTHSFAVCPGELFCDSSNPLRPITLNASQDTATITNGVISTDSVDNPVQLNSAIADYTTDTIIGTYRYVQQSTGIATNNIAQLETSCPRLLVTPPETNVGQAALAWNNSFTNTNATIPDPIPVDNQLAAISQEPILVQLDDLDPASATAPRQLTHKFFAHSNYTWRESRFTPFIGIGGEIEWAIDSCNSFGVNQWGVLVKAGMSF